MQKIKDFIINGKIVGTVYKDSNEELVYLKRVNSEKHKLRIYPAYGVDKSVYDVLLEKNVKRLIINETDTGKCFEGDFTTLKPKEKDLGYGQQVFFALKDLTQIK